MQWKRKTIGAVLAVLVMLTATPSVIASVQPGQIVPAPWSFGVEWIFTWRVADASSSFMRGTKIRFTVQEINASMPGQAIGSWILNGNVSRYMDLGGGAQWIPFKGQTTYARYNASTGSYMFTDDAYLDSIFIVPMLLPSPVGCFQDGVSSRYNSTAWNITTDGAARTFYAVNKTNGYHVVSVAFHETGAASEFRRTQTDGSVDIHLVLEEVYNPDEDWTLLLNVLTYALIGTIIVIILIILFRKYKINVKDLVRGKTLNKTVLDDEIATGPDNIAIDKQDADSKEQNDEAERGKS